LEHLGEISILKIQRQDQRDLPEQKPDRPGISGQDTETDENYRQVTIERVKNRDRKSRENNGRQE